MYKNLEDDNLTEERRVLIVFGDINSRYGV